MATSLARQLKSIRSDITATLDKRKFEKVSSLLFEPDEAAVQDFDTILALGQNGLHGLIQIDSRFQKFEKTLFSETAKGIDRAIQTKAENDNWDTVVNQFLDFVAPHALSREASKALEWLVRRFKIHQFPLTADTLILTLMPYHTTSLFGRVLQIVSLQPNFSFLSQYNDIRTSSTLPPVPRQLFIRALSRDPVFLEAYFTFVVTRVKSGNGYSSMITLWSGLTIEAILQMRQARKNEETIVSQIMPFVAQGLQMKQSSDFQIASYMVLTILASSRTLTHKVVEAAMDAICLGWTDESRKYGLMCLATLAQREGELYLTDAVVQSLLSLEDTMGQIQSIPSKASSSKLLVPLATKLVTSNKISEIQFPILTGVLQSEAISAEDRQAVIQAAIKQFLNGNQKSRSAIGKWLSSVASDHAEALKAAAAPLLNVLDSAHLAELENITQLQLTVQEEPEMMDIEETDSQDIKLTGVDLWSSLPEELSNPSFFLNTPEHALFLERFIDAAKSENPQMDKFLTSPALSKSTVSLPSLFARVFITVSHSIRVRTTALNQFTQFVNTADSTLDFQGFIPHLIAALSDTAKDIREAAATAVTALYKSYSSTATRNTVVGLTDLYPEEGSGTLKWLLAHEAKWLVDTVLMPKLAECQLDGGYVIRSLATLLNGAGKKGKKEQNPTSVMVFLASHIVCSPISSLQFVLLSILNHGAIVSPAAVRLKVSALEPLLARCRDASFTSALLIREKQIDSADFKKELVQIVGIGASATQISFLVDLVLAHGPLATAACQQLAVLFPSTSHATQLHSAKLLINQLESGPSGLAKVASSTLASSALPTSIILSIFDDVKLEVDSRDSSPARKRQRTDSARSSPGVIPEGLMQSTRRLTLCLEVLERQNPEQHVPVIAPLFGILDRLIAVETDTRTSLNYPKQMVLSCLISTETNTQFDSNAFRIDTLISCIRTSTNPQVHNRTLLLLAALAHVVPGLILTHVMPIFTFMGASVLRQDDEYSSHVIEQTIKSVIPVLVSATSAGNAKVETTPIISAFMVNFDFIPKHRRLSLFKILVETLGPEEHLPLTLLLLAEKGCQRNEKTKLTTAEFGSDLLNSFMAPTRLVALDNFLTLLVRLPLEPSEDGEDMPIDLKSYSREKLAALKNECIGIVDFTIGTRSFQVAVGRAFASGDVSFLTTDYFSPIVEKLLVLASQAPKHHGRVVKECLDGILSALPLQLVANIVETFLKTERNTKVTNDMITIATDRLSKSTSDVSLKASLGQMISLLNDTIESSNDVEAMVVALKSLAKLSRVHGKAELPSFEKVLPALISRGVGSNDRIVKENAVGCLESMLYSLLERYSNPSPVLGARILPSLPDIMSLVLDELDVSAKLTSEDCQRSILSFLTSLYKRIPSFMATYVSRVVILLIRAAATRNETAEIIEAREALLQSITENINTDVCIEAISECWTEIPHERKMLETLTTVVELVIVAGNREDLTGSSQMMFELFLNLFDVRSEAVVKPKNIQQIEARVSEVFLKLVMKLNDTTFRPFFITLRDWTFRNVDGEKKLSRQIFFYGFLNKFLEVLQTVVTAYYGIILDDTVQLLNDFKIGMAESKVLWSSVIHSLDKSFSHDLEQDSYWSSPTRFNKVILPLLSQLTLSGNSAIVTQAIVSLTSKARSEENCKTINNCLMEYMKSESTSVRLAAVNTQRELYAHVSGEWLKMLPPTVPVISEVMEDEDDNVIEAAHLLIATIEKVGGISMQKLLT